MRKKLTLTRREQQEHDANAKRLSAVGTIPQEVNSSPGAQLLSIEQMGGPVDSFVHASPSGGYGMVICVRIVVLKSGINLSDCEITPSKWRDDAIELQPAHEQLGYSNAVGGVEYPKDDVLNPWISSTRSLEYGRVLEGVIIARSFASLPKWCENGMSIEADLYLFDQFENQYPLQVDLRVIRDAKREVPRRRSTGLFGSAVTASVHGARVERTERSDRDDVSRKVPNMPRPNGGVH